jgi:hypothetical protein
MVGAQAVSGFVFVLGSSLLGAKPDWARLQLNGLYLSFATCCSAPVVVALAWLFASLRNGLPPRQYLALRPVPMTKVLRWCLALAVLATLSDCVTALLGRPIVPQVMRDIYETAGWAPLLWVVLLVVAPISEEVLFRGFLFEGLAQSRVGSVGAIGLSSALWAGIHLQYDLYGIADVFVSGLLLGLARWKTNSLFTSMVMHGLMNLIATVELVVLRG